MCRSWADGEKVLVASPLHWGDPSTCRVLNRPCFLCPESLPSLDFSDAGEIVQWRDMHLVKIVSIDPGGTTGICLVDDANLIWCSEIREIPHLVKALQKLLQQADAVVIEDFVGSGAAKDYYDPVRVIGAVEAVMASSHLPLVKQVPGKQMRYRETVRAMHKSPHVRSALAHAFYYLKQRGRI